MFSSLLARKLPHFPFLRELNLVAKPAGTNRVAVWPQPAGRTFISTNDQGLVWWPDHGLACWSAECLRKRKKVSQENTAAVPDSLARLLCPRPLPTSRIKQAVLLKMVLFLHVLMHTPPHPRSPFLSEIGEQVESQLCRVITDPSVAAVIHGVLQVTLET